MSKLAIITTLLAVLYLPVLIGACVVSHRRGMTRGKREGHDDFSKLWAAREHGLNDYDRSH